jgi:hypothetical protein
LYHTKLSMSNLLQAIQQPLSFGEQSVQEDKPLDFSSLSFEGLEEVPSQSYPNDLSPCLCLTL